MWSRVWPNICRLCLKPCFLNFSITIIISTTWQLFHLWQTSNIFVITVIIIIMILNIMINTSPSSEIFAKTQSGVLWLDTRAICIFWIFQNPPDQPSPSTIHIIILNKTRLNLSIETQLEPELFLFQVSTAFESPISSSWLFYLWKWVSVYLYFHFHIVC